jgi:putative membrane protein
VPELVARLAGNLAALWVAAEVFDDVSYGGSFGVLLLAAVVFTIANWLVKPVVAVLAIPLIILSLGVAYFFVNVLMLLVTDWVVGDFEAGGFWTVVGATVVVWLVNLVISAAASDWVRHGERRRRRCRSDH